MILFSQSSFFSRNFAVHIQGENSLGSSTALLDEAWRADTMISSQVYVIMKS